MSGSEDTECCAQGLVRRQRLIALYSAQILRVCLANGAQFSPNCLLHGCQRRTSRYAVGCESVIALKASTASRVFSPK